MRPGTVSLERAALLLDCPYRFAVRMARRGLLHVTNGAVDVPSLMRLKSHVVFSHLGTPMSEGELCRLFNARDVPIRTLAGSDGDVMRIAGCDYMRPWAVLDAAWDAYDGHEKTGIR